MKCPNCKTEMIKGTLKNRWDVDWYARRGLNWINRGKKTMFAYNCPKCGKVELRTEE
jgi:predicted RNA-binding Zn-ribbon protein involved in translation (DUF1610 family)